MVNEEGAKRQSVKVWLKSMSISPINPQLVVAVAPFMLPVKAHPVKVVLSDAYPTRPPQWAAPS